MARNAGFRNAAPRARKNIGPYAVLSLVSFVCALVILALYLWKADKLVALGLSGNFYYIVLLPLGLSVSAFLFGALRSYGVFRGRLFGGALELGGPAVAFFLVLVLGFKLPPPASDFAVTVYVHGPVGLKDLVLKSRGYVLMDTGGLSRKEQIGEIGQAFFPGISANFRDQEVTVGLDADGYEMSDPSQRIRLDSTSAYLEVRKKAGRITGYVQDEEGYRLDNVSITVAGITAPTKLNGTFEISIPGEALQPQLKLLAVAAGYQLWSDFVVPNSNEVTITLIRRR